MANETRPRRESSSTSRIRKAVSVSSGGPAPTSSDVDETGLNAPAPDANGPDPIETPPPVANDRDDRNEREPYPQERPADREPIRFLRDRVERESGVPVRERLAATASERRESSRRSPATATRAPPARDPRRPATSPSPAATATRPHRARDRDREYPPAVRTEREPVATASRRDHDPAARRPAGGRRGHLRRRRDPRPLRGDQARRDPPHRAAEDDDAPAHPHREDRGRHRVHRPEEAGPDLQDPQGAGQAERPDVRRGDARGAARRLRLPPQPRLQLPALPRRHLRLAQPDPPLRPARPARSSPARSGRPRRTSATSPCCASRRSTTRTPTC